MASNEFKLRFVADTKKLRQDLGIAQNKIGNFSSQTQKSITKWGGAFKLAGVAAVAGLTAAGKAIQSYTEKGDAVDKASKRIGIAAEEFQKLGFAAEQSGATSEQVEKAFSQLALKLDEAATGSETALSAFDALGLSMDNLNTASRTEQFKMLADGVASIEDPTKRAAAAQLLLGEEGVQLIPLLSQGSEAIAEFGRQAEATGSIMSGKAVADAARLNDAMNTIKHTLGGVLNEVLGPIIPVLADLAEKLGPLLGNALSTIVPTLSNLAESLFPALVSVLDLAVVTLEALNPILNAAAHLLAHAIVPAITVMSKALKLALIPAIEAISWAIEDLVGLFVTGLNKIISAINVIPGIPDIPLIPALELTAQRSDEAAIAFDEAGKNIKQSATREWTDAAGIITGKVSEASAATTVYLEDLYEHAWSYGDGVVRISSEVSLTLDELDKNTKLWALEAIDTLEEVGINWRTLANEDVRSTFEQIEREQGWGIAQMGIWVGSLEDLIDIVNDKYGEWQDEISDTRTAYDQLVATSEHATQQLVEDAGSLDDISFINWRQEILDTDQAMKDMQLTVAGFEESHGSAGFENWYVKMRDLRDFTADTLESQRGITQEIAERNVIIDPLGGLDNESLAGLTGVEAVGLLQRALREFELAALADDKLTLGEVQHIGRIESQLSSVARAFGIDLKAIEQYTADMNQRLEDLNRKEVELPKIIEGTASESLLQAQEAARQAAEQSDKLQSIGRLGAEGIIIALETGLITQADILAAHMQNLIPSHVWNHFLHLTSAPAPSPSPMPTPTSMSGGFDSAALSAALRGAASDVAAVPNITFTKQGSGIVATLPTGTVFIPGWYDPIQYLKDNFNIPGLARGGIVTRPTLALIGESGPEAVVPLDRGNTGGITVNFYGDVYGDELALGRAVTDALAEQERLTGAALAV